MATKPIILHLGNPVAYNTDLFNNQFSQQYTIISPTPEECSRENFKAALQSKKWGDFTAIFRPHWSTGNEMVTWDKELIDLLPASCKIFASACAGFDWVDTQCMASRGIVYCNGATASTESVADMAIWHIIACYRNLVWSFEAARSGDKDQWLDAHLNVPETASNPIDSVLGIVGLGQIGYRIAQKAYDGLGMKIRYFDVVRKSESMESAIKAKFVESMDQLIREADCVILATPLPNNGKPVVTSEFLSKMKKGSKFVNIARGQLVDESSLVEALKSGHLFAAGLDVFQDEPNVHPELTKMKNVSLTTHNGGGSVNTMILFERLAMENILGYLGKGREGLKTPVNLQWLKE